MPIFEYVCNHCGKRFEKLVLKREMAVSCPRCKKNKVEKLISSFATIGSPRGRGGDRACGTCQRRNCSTC